MTQNSYGYIRVSSTDQNEDRQLMAMRELTIPEKHLFVEKQSGKDFERPQYKKMVRRTCSTSRVLTGWGGIMARFWNSGAS